MSFLRTHGEVFLLLLAAATAALWLAAREFFPPLSASQQVLLLAALVLWTAGLAWCLFRASFPFFSRYKVQIAVTFLILYVISLALITVSELFDLGWFSWL